MAQPVRMNVCNYKGECVPLKLDFTQMVDGLRVDIQSENVPWLIDALEKADDELQESRTDDWQYQPPSH